MYNVYSIPDKTIRSIHPYASTYAFIPISIPPPMIKVIAEGLIMIYQYIYISPYNHTNLYTLKGS